MLGYSIGQIATSLGVAVHHIEWIVRSRGVKPDFRAGNVRVFSTDAVEKIREALAAVKSKSGVAHAPA